MNYKKVIVAINLEKETTASLTKIKKLAISRESEVHLIYCFELLLTTVDFVPMPSPSDEDLVLIKKLMEEKLMALKESLGLQDHNVIATCLISRNAKQDFLQYADEVRGDLVIAASEEKAGIKGFFEGSFTSFLSKFTRADLLILR